MVRLGYHSITWGGVVGAPQGVTSIKDLYYLSNGAVDVAVRDIADAGYQGVEVFDGNLVPYADRSEVLLDQLEESGLELISVYTGANFIYADALPDEMHRIRAACGLASSFGGSRPVVGGGAPPAPRPTKGGYDPPPGAPGAGGDKAHEP